MFDIVRSGGWMMFPILAASVLALAIITERFWTLRAAKLAPKSVLAQLWELLKNKQLDRERIDAIRQKSALGRILAVGLLNAKHGREAMKESIEEVAAQEIHRMERYLGALGTIAAVTPLMGLLGTVLGMIRVFSDIMLQGTGQANVLAGGISEALITTAAGLMVAIPALICHRMLERKVDDIVVFMEHQSIKLIDALHGERDASTASFTSSSAQ